MNIKNAPRPLRAMVQVFVIVVLLLGAFIVGDLRDDVTQRDNALSTTEDITREVCNAATIGDLREADLLAECTLAQDEELVDKVVEDAPQTPESTPTPNPIPDAPTGVSAAEQAALTRSAVEDYFAANPLPDPQYEARIKAAVNSYLQANPPVGLAPTTAALRKAVRAFLLANPPNDGQDGATGVGVATAATDGCDVVFTYTDGTTTRVGPLCGPPPTAEQLRAAAAAYCEANPDDCRGPVGPAGPAGPVGPSGVIEVIDDCNPPEGEVVVDVDLTYLPEQRAVRQTCDTAPGFPGLGGGGP